MSSSAIEYCVIGGGIVGLAIAARLSSFGSTVLLEQHDRLITETSSRNSGVIHAGMYYPIGTKKSQLCVEGNRNTWTMLRKYPTQLVARRIGKWIGATSPDEVPVLHRLTSTMTELGIPFSWLTREAMKQEEPRVAFLEAFESPSTGIVDVHSLADLFEGAIQASPYECAVQRRCAVRQVRVLASGAHLSLSSAAGDDEHSEPLVCNHVVCSLGLHTDPLWRSGKFLVQSDGRTPIPFDPKCTTHFCRGRYVGYRERGIVKRLVYPCPLPHLKGLGMHSVLDVDGAVRFGADAHYVDRMDDLAVTDDPQFVQDAFDAVRKFIPTVERGKMFVDFAGMRPKLSGPGEGFRDFYVEALPQHPHVMVLAGIESPGLTCATSIADLVCKSLLGETRASTVTPLWK